MKKFIFCFFTILLSSCIFENPTEEAWSLEPGDKMPSFNVVVTDGTIASSTNLAKKNTIIVFFNTQCADCRKELPEIEKVYEKIKDNPDYYLICISRSEDYESVISYWRENNFTMPVSPQINADVYKLFATSCIPRVYIFNNKGVLQKVYTDNPLPTSEEILLTIKY